MPTYAVLVIWKTGEEEYLHQGLGSKTARFVSRAAAQRQADFMKMGMEEEVQSINVVQLPPLPIAKRKGKESIDAGT